MSSDNELQLIESKLKLMFGDDLVSVCEFDFLPDEYFDEEQDITEWFTFDFGIKSTIPDKDIFITIELMIERKCFCDYHPTEYWDDYYHEPQDNDVDYKTYTAQISIYNNVGEEEYVAEPGIGLNILYNQTKNKWNSTESGDLEKNAVSFLNKMYSRMNHVPFEFLTRYINNYKYIIEKIRSVVVLILLAQKKDAHSLFYAVPKDVVLIILKMVFEMRFYPMDWI